MDAIRNVWSFILYSTGGLYVFFHYLEITVWLLVVWLLGVSLIHSKALLTLWELLSVCVCMCVSIVCSFKSMDYLIWIPSPHRQSVWVVLPWVNFLCVKEMSSIHWPALWSLDYWANICVDVCAACLEGSCVFVSVFAFQSCVYVCRCLF